jgi:hypothetical protein
MCGSFYNLQLFISQCWNLNDQIILASIVFVQFQSRIQGKSSLNVQMAKLQMQKVTMVLTQSYYSWNFGENVNMLINGSTTVRSVTLGVGDNSSIDATMLGTALDSVESDEFVVLAVEPLQALDIWRAAYGMVRN